jgi:hypothetical protein
MVDTTGGSTDTDNSNLDGPKMENTGADVVQKTNAADSILNLPPDQMQATSEDGEESEPEMVVENTNPDTFSAIKSWTDRMGANELYKLYVSKLENEEKEVKLKRPKKGDLKQSKKDHKVLKSSKLVKGVVDYVRVLEQRIQTLENKLLDDIDEETSSDTKKTSGDVELDLKFFDAETEFDDMGYHISANHTIPGTYICRTDPQNLIRALFQWKHNPLENQSARLDSTLPSPTHIRLISLGITSAPIKAFLENKIGTTRTSPFTLIRFTAPFRPLIAEFDALKIQLDKLEELYG